MKTNIWRAVVVVLALFSTTAWAIKEGETFPPNISIAAADASGTPLNAANLAGKVTIINFWATWCKACKVELKEMEAQITPLLKDKDFRFAFVSLDKELSAAKAWVKDNLKSQEFIACLQTDPEFKAAEVLGVDAFPMTLLVDQKGRVVKVQRGFEEGKGLTEGLVSAAKALLQAAPAAKL